MSASQAFSQGISTSAAGLSSARAAVPTVSNRMVTMSFMGRRLHGGVRGRNPYDEGMAEIIDSHCHLDFPDYGAELPEVLARARAAGIVRMICIGSGRDITSARSAVTL